MRTHTFLKVVGWKGSPRKSNRLRTIGLTINKQMQSSKPSKTIKDAGDLDIILRAELTEKELANFASIQECMDLFITWIIQEVKKCRVFTLKPPEYLVVDVDPSLYYS